MTARLPRLASPLRELPPVLWAFCFSSVFLGLLCLAVEWFCTHKLHLPSMPYGRPILSPESTFADVWMFRKRFTHFHESSFFTGPWNSDFLYPAPLGLIYRLLYALPKYGWLFLGFVLLSWLAGAVIVARALRTHGVARNASIAFAVLCAISCYAFYFEFNRANLEIFVWGFSALGVFFFLKDRPWAAALLIGLAGACKGYPFIYLGLLLARRKYLPAAFAVAFALVLNLFSCWALAGNLALGRAGVSGGLREFRTLYVLAYDPPAIGVDHSLFALIKRSLSPYPPPAAMEHVAAAYILIAGLLATAVFFLRVVRMPTLNQLVFLTAAAVLLPPVSFDYTLLHIYIGWLPLVLLSVHLWHQRLRISPVLWLAFSCYVLILSPLNEVILHGVRCNGQIKCLALLLLAGTAATLPFPASAPSLSRP